MVGQHQETVIIETDQVSSLLRDENGKIVSTAFKSIDENLVRERDLRDSVLIWKQHEATPNGHRRNRPFENAVSTKLHQEWRGPVIVFKYTDLNNKVQEDLRTTPRFIQDVGPRDFRDLVDYCTVFYTDMAFYNMRTMPKTVFFNTKVLKGVRLNCYGDCVIANLDTCSGATITRLQARYEGRTSPISHLLGLLLYVSRCHADSRWCRGERINDKSPFENSQVTALFQNIDPLAGDLGSVDMQWKKCVGSMIITRVDEKPLSMQQAKIICELCSEKIPQALHGLEAGYNDTIATSRAVVSSKINPLLRAAAVELRVTFIDVEKETMTYDDRVLRRMGQHHE